MKKDEFDKFLTWAVLVPIVFPCLILVVILVSTGTFSGQALFGRAGFLLFAATGAGKAYSERLSCPRPTNPDRLLIWRVSGIVLPVLSLTCAGLYAWAEALPSMIGSDLLAACVMIFGGLSILAQMAAHYCYNQLS